MAIRMCTADRIVYTIGASVACGVMIMKLVLPLTPRVSVRLCKINTTCGLTGGSLWFPE